MKKALLLGIFAVFALMNGRYLFAADTTPPTTPAVNIVSYNAATDTLLVCGSSTDKESAVDRFEYKVTKGTDVIRDWTSVLPGIGSRPDRYFYAYTLYARGMNLRVGGTFTVSVKAINKAGLVSGINSKNKTIPPTQ